MRRIEVRQSDASGSSDDASAEDRVDIWIDGALLSTRARGRNGDLHVWPYEAPKGVRDPFFDMSLAELGRASRHVWILKKPVLWAEPVGSVSYADVLVTRDWADADRTQESWSVRSYFDLDGLEWNRPWTIRDLGRELNRAVAEDTALREFSNDEVLSDSELPGIAINWRCIDDTMPIGSVLSTAHACIERAFALAHGRLSSTLRPDAVVSTFHFPVEIQSACVQYLSYFAQFLRDLGIDANTEVQERVRDVLFAVTPLDGPESLSRIREALATYGRIGISVCEWRG